MSIEAEGYNRISRFLNGEPPLPETPVAMPSAEAPREVKSLGQVFNEEAASAKLFSAAATNESEAAGFRVNYHKIICLNK